MGNNHSANLSISFLKLLLAWHAHAYLCALCTQAVEHMHGQSASACGQYENWISLHSCHKAKPEKPVNTVIHFSHMAFGMLRIIHFSFCKDFFLITVGIFPLLQMVERDLTRPEPGCCNYMTCVWSTGPLRTAHTELTPWGYDTTFTLPPPSG